jgi:hypothetical protein
LRTIARHLVVLDRLLDVGLDAVERIRGARPLRGGVGSHQCEERGERREARE